MEKEFLPVLVCNVMKVHCWNIHKTFFQSSKHTDKMAINANEILLKEEVAYVPALTLLIAKNFGIEVQNHSLQVPSNQIMQNTSVIIYIHDPFYGYCQNTPCILHYRCTVLYFYFSIKDPQNYLCIDMGSIIVKFQHFLKAKVV